MVTVRALGASWLVGCLASWVAGGAIAIEAEGFGGAGCGMRMRRVGMRAGLAARRVNI